MTKEEAQEMLENVTARIQAQGRIVDARLLDKKTMLEKLIKSYQ